MITPDAIRQKVARQYLACLRAWQRGEPYAPLSFPAGPASTDFALLRREVQLLQSEEKNASRPGYRIEYQVQRTRALHTQTLPTRVWLDTLEDLLCVLQKEQEFAFFQQDITLLREQVPQLIAWSERFPAKVLEWHSCWPELLAVCCYFLAYPRPGLYIRELPINVHTKFIEQHQGILRELLDELLPPETVNATASTFQQRYGLREEAALIHVRFLAEQLQERYAFPVNELALPAAQLAQLDFRSQTCIITENKQTFLALPHFEHTLAILGGGFKVGSLAALPWLQESPIVYWGDLDAQGFQILAQLRSIFPHVVSVMMDLATWNAFHEFSVPGTPCRVRQLPGLTAEEHALFVTLAESDQRLEQEHISHSYALARLQTCLLALAR